MITKKRASCAGIQSIHFTHIPHTSTFRPPTTILSLPLKPHKHILLTIKHPPTPSQIFLPTLRVLPFGERLRAITLADVHRIPALLDHDRALAAEDVVAAASSGDISLVEILEGEVERGRILTSHGPEQIRFGPHGIASRAGIVSAT